jgi:hypothetical protein
MSKESNEENEGIGGHGEQVAQVQNSCNLTAS